MRVLLRKFLRHEYHTLNNIYIGQNRLIENYRLLESLHSGVGVAPVLKSNAYGHGLVPVARILNLLAPPFICVDSLYEAYEIHKAGIHTPLLIMGYINPLNLRTKKLPFSYSAWDLETVRAIVKYQPHAGIHLFADTGMNREGIPIARLPAFLKELKKINGLRITGLMSHLAAGDQPDHRLTRRQYANFLSARKILHGFSLEPRWLHINASAGHLHGPSDNISNVSRCGLALYGYDPAGKKSLLKPVLRFCSTLVQIKQVTKGKKVGYDFTYTAPKSLTLGILPVGYNDGLNRRLSDCGTVTIGGINCPIIGRISMNLTAIDISRLSRPRIGMEVEIIGSGTIAANSLETIAGLCSAIPYEILVQLHSSIRRTIE